MLNILFDFVATLKAPAFFVALLILLCIAGRMEETDAELIAGADLKIENPLHIATQRQEATCR